MYRTFKDLVFLPEFVASLHRDSMLSAILLPQLVADHCVVQNTHGFGYGLPRVVASRPSDGRACFELLLGVVSWVVRWSAEGLSQINPCVRHFMVVSSVDWSSYLKEGISADEKHWTL